MRGLGRRAEERERRQLSVGLSLNPDEAGALPAAAFDEDQRVGWLLSVLKERVSGAGLMWKLLKLMPEEDRAREEKGEHEWLSGHCRVLFAIGAASWVPLRTCRLLVLLAVFHLHATRLARRCVVCILVGGGH